MNKNEIIGLIKKKVSRSGFKRLNDTVNLLDDNIDFEVITFSNAKSFIRMLEKVYADENNLDIAMYVMNGVIQTFNQFATDSKLALVRLELTTLNDNHNMILVLEEETI